MKTSLTFAAAVGLMAANAAADQCVNDPPGSDSTVDREVVIRLHPGMDWPATLAMIETLIPGSIVLDDTLANWNIYALQLPLGTDECDGDDILADALMGPVPDPARPLLWAETGYFALNGEGHTGSVYDSGRANYAVGYPQQYFLAQAGAGVAQRLSSGTGITIAVIDTGVDAAHPALAGFVRSDGVNLVRENNRPAEDTRDIGDGLDSDGDGEVDEMTGHGTFVAGLIRLVAPEAQILPIVALDSDGAASAYTTAKGIFLAIDAGAQVINCSFGTTFDSDLYIDAMLEARDRGVLVVTAAGNRGLDLPELPNVREYPASAHYDFVDTEIKLAISVAAVDSSDIRVPTSSYYNGIQVACPGGSLPLNDGSGAYDAAQSIISTLPGGEFGVWEGTSFACAIVSGAAALLQVELAHLPLDMGLAPVIVPPATEPVAPIWAKHDELRRMFRRTGENIDSLNPEAADQIGRRLDIEALLLEHLPGDLDGDKLVTISDLAMFLAEFGQATPVDQYIYLNSDLNRDRAIDLSDLSILLTYFGR